MKLLFATRNQGKVREFRQLMGDLVEVISLLDVDMAPEVEEDGETFQDNARKKAESCANVTGIPSVADDSGLCVDALDGRPGVYSARYAPGDDRDRYEKLLKELKDVPKEKRGAAFVCALCLAFPDGRVLFSEGECRGRIAQAPKGEHGFGYDPVFEVDDNGRTMAELTAEEKSALSHRGMAFRALRPALKKLVEEVEHA